MALTVYLRGADGYEFVAEILGDNFSSAGHGFRRQIDAVGAHIGNEADRAVADIDAFIEPLGDLHGARGGQPELARGFLLQRGRGEGRVGVALDGLGLDRGDGEFRLIERRLERPCFVPGADIEPADLLAVGADETRGEGRAGLGLQMSEDRPIFARDEFLDLEFAIADDAQRDRLHAPGRAGAGQLAPQHRRERETDEIVERAAGAIGVDQRFVDLAGMSHRILHRLLGDGVEHDSIDALVLEQFLALQDLVDMPGDRLSLTVGVGGENDAVGILDRAADVAEPLGRLGVHFPAHREIVLGVYRAILGRQIADMAERGVDVIILA